MNRPRRRSRRPKLRSPTEMFKTRRAMHRVWGSESAGGIAGVLNTSFELLTSWKRFASGLVTLVVPSLALRTGVAGFLEMPEVAVMAMMPVMMPRVPEVAVVTMMPVMAMVTMMAMVAMMAVVSMVAMVPVMAMMAVAGGGGVGRSEEHDTERHQAGRKQFP